MRESIYVAARFGRKQEMKEVLKRLILEGYVPRCRWINEEPENIPEERRERHMREWASKDVEDVASADTLILFTEDLLSKAYLPSSWATGGRHVEFGIAYVLGKRIVLIGPRQNVFHHLSRVEIYKSLEEFLRAEESKAKHQAKEEASAAEA